MEAHTLQTDLIKTLELMPASHTEVTLSTREHHLEVQSPGPEVTVTLKCAGIIKSAGQMRLMRSDLLHALKAEAAPTGIVQLVQRPEGSTLKVGDNSTTWSPAADFKPEETPLKPMATFSRTLMQQLSKVAPVCMLQGVEPEYTCISLEPSENGKLRLVATDGFRLSLEEVSHSGTLRPCLLPARHVKLLHTLFRASANLHLSQQGDRLHVFTQQAWVSVRMLEGPFIGYQQSIPQDIHLEVGLDGQSVLKAMQGMSSVLRTQAIPGVTLRMTATGGELQVTTEKGLQTKSIEARATGPWHGEVQVTVDARHLADAIRQLEPYVILKVTRDVTAPVVLSSGDPSSLAVLVPLLAG